MNVIEALRSRRSIRRFCPDGMPEEIFRKILEVLRYAPSGSNRQKLRYIAVTSQEKCREVFACTAWGRLVTPRRQPEWGKDAPQYFLAVTVSGASGPLAHAEAGAAIQSVMLAATAAGFGSCWLGAFDRDKVKAILGIGAESELLYLVAFGQPAENPVTDEITDENGVNYYLDSNDVLHVPKLALNKLVEFV